MNAVEDLRAVVEALEAENAVLRAQLAYVVAQSSVGFARGRIRKPAGTQGEVA